MSDEILRARFRALASAEARSAPLLSPRRLAGHRVTVYARRARRAWQLTGATALIGAAAAALFIARPRQPQLTLDLSAITWTAPTDFLLETPGAAYLRSLPAIGLPQPSIVRTSADRDDTSRRNQ